VPRRQHGRSLPPLQGIVRETGSAGERQLVIADEAYLRDSILLRKILRPVIRTHAIVSGRLSEEQLFEVIEYVKSIGNASSNQSLPERLMERQHVYECHFNSSVRSKDRFPGITSTRNERSSPGFLTTDQQADRAAVTFSHAVLFHDRRHAAAMMRLELITPAGDMVTSETFYNKLFTIHGP